MHIIWVKILEGMEYQYHTSLNMHIMADHVTDAHLEFLKFWVRVLKCGVLAITGMPDRNSGLAEFQSLHFFGIFMHFII